MTDQAQFNELNRLVGSLTTSVANMTQTWQRQEDAAVKGRRIIHDKLDAFRIEVNSKLSDLSGRVTKMEDKVAGIAPSVKEFNDERLRDEGARRSGKRLWYWILTAAGLGGWGIHEVISWFRH